MKKCFICRIAALVTAFGAINWGAVAIFHTNLVAVLLGDMTFSARIIYGLIGGMGVIVLISSLGWCPGCKRQAA